MFFSYRLVPLGNLLLVVYWLVFKNRCLCSFYTCMFMHMYIDTPRSRQDVLFMFCSVFDLSWYLFRELVVDLVVKPLLPFVYCFRFPETPIFLN